MPEVSSPAAPSSARRDLFVGGSDGVTYALPLDAVDGILLFEDLPARRREVNLPGLLDLPPTAREADRYARVRGLDEPSYMRLGATVRALDVDASKLEPVPPILRTTAARWGWAGVMIDGERATILVDALSLARIGARRGGVT